ncbi:MAG: magnesium and cobalt transport protein CorA [Isosphaera sp.]|nr:magnesium and cobalt transport protein CorA [Isosphaera sp.]
MITVLHWDAAARTCCGRSHDELPPTAAAADDDDVWWVDLSDPTPAEEEKVFRTFLPVHSLTFGDITKERRTPSEGTHLPKVEEFPDYLFAVVNPLPPGLAESLGPAKKGAPRPSLRELRERRKHRPQLSAVMTRNVLVTHHYRPLACVDAARGFAERHADAARRGPDFLFHHVLDAMVDEYSPVVDAVGARLDALETRVFRDPSPQLLARLLRLKRVVTGLRKTLILEREVLARLTRGEFDLVDEREIVYYRNVYDHLVRYTELVEAAREMVSDLMESHLSAVSTRLNQVMKVLTMISTVVLPMTLVAGVYGMNFEENVSPSFKSDWGFPFALGMMALLGVGSVAYFRARRWL